MCFTRHPGGQPLIPVWFSFSFSLVCVLTSPCICNCKIISISPSLICSKTTMEKGRFESTFRVTKIWDSVLPERVGDGHRLTRVHSAPSELIRLGPFQCRVLWPNWQVQYLDRIKVLPREVVRSQAGEREGQNSAQASVAERWLRYPS